MAKLTDFTPDNRNANKGTAKGQKMIVRSIQEDGFGRSVLADKTRPFDSRESDIYAQFLPVVLPFVNGPCYAWFASSVGKPVFDAIIGNGCEIHAMIIWNKVNATYAAMNAQYKQRHEPCMYFKPKGSTLRWVGASTECTVWDEKRDAQNNYHPTQKPVVLPERAINNHDAKIIVDPFSGSGTTIIACENLGRIAGLSR